KAVGSGTQPGGGYPTQTVTLPPVSVTLPNGQQYGVGGGSVQVPGAALAPGQVAWGGVASCQGVGSNPTVATVLCYELAGVIQSAPPRPYVRFTSLIQTACTSSTAANASTVVEVLQSYVPAPGTPAVCPWEDCTPGAFWTGVYGVTVTVGGQMDGVWMGQDVTLATDQIVLIN